MTASSILEALSSRGVALEPAGDRLRFRPASAVPPDLKAALVEHKGEILALLRGGTSDRDAQVAAPPPARDEVDRVQTLREHLAEHGWAVLRSWVLGGERVLLVWASDAEIPEEVADLPQYTRDEVARLVAADPETLRAVHEIKRTFPGAIVLPAGCVEATA